MHRTAVARQTASHTYCSAKWADYITATRARRSLLQQGMAGPRCPSNVRLLCSTPCIRANDNWKSSGFTPRPPPRRPLPSLAGPPRGPPPFSPFQRQQQQQQQRDAVDQKEQNSPLQQPETPPQPKAVPGWRAQLESQQQARNSRGKTGSPSPASAGATPVEPERPMNERIPYPTIILVSITGENLGPKPLTEALTTFDRATADLVLVNTKLDPPLCRVMPKDKAKARAIKAGLAAFEKPVRNAKIAKEVEGKVVVVDVETGTTKGVMSVDDALKDLKLDTYTLLLYSQGTVPKSFPKATVEPPENGAVVYIVSHDEQDRLRAEGRSSSSSSKSKSKSGNASNNVVKEIELGSTISAHDLQIKLAKARQFLESKHRLQIGIVQKRGAPKGAVQTLVKSVRHELKGFGTVVNEQEAENGRKTLLDYTPGPPKKK
ncbi:uncharacterized protein EV422DRAFT_533150 [Fimicolochytrium jonesii]|uniref:uncharacterized protein n=1 Tax=Fimicolochytrium jonesii TaxID=1396493 RepID=UPI0022FE0924|nr:uncharacterized protein EV422DRAFT_533150 [Fimicolochytrium jonesii]KAI8819992.1 hypothetical protein EV422DRAFT_533150 [Fimicolochytrium jonesii]